MAVDRNVLALALELTEVLRGYQQLESGAEKAFGGVEAAADAADTSKLETELRQLLDRTLALGERGKDALRGIGEGAAPAAAGLAEVRSRAGELALRFEQAGAEYAQVQARLKDARGKEEIRLLERQSERLAAELERVGNEAQEAGRDIARAMNVSEAEADEARLSVIRLERALEGVRREEARVNRGGAGRGGILTRLRSAHAAAAALGAALATGAIAIGIRKVTEAVAEQEAADAKLAQVLEQIDAAQNLTLEGLKKQASAFQAQTTFGDELIQSLQGLLIRYAELGDEATVGRATKLTLDMAAAMGGSADASAVQLAKSLALLRGGLTEANVAITNLRRAGVVLSTDQVTLIKRLVETGQTAEAQAALMEALEAKYAGAAEAARNNLKGAMEALNNTFGDTLEVIGEAGLADALKTVTQRMEQLLLGSEGTAKALGEVLAVLVQIIAAVVTAPAAFQKFIDALTKLQQGQETAADASRALTVATNAYFDALEGGDLERAGVALSNLISLLQEQGRFDATWIEIINENLTLLVDKYESAGRDVPASVRNMVASFEALTKAQEAATAGAVDGAAMVAEALDKWRAAVLALRDEQRKTAEEASKAANLQIGAIGDYSQATQEQLRAAITAIDEAEQAWELYGQEVPAHLRDARHEIQQHLSITEDLANAAADAAQKVFDLVAHVGDLATANKAQVAAVESAVKATLDAYELAGEKVPEEIDRIAKRLGVLSTAQQKVADDAKKAAEKTLEAYRKIADGLGDILRTLRPEAGIEAGADLLARRIELEREIQDLQSQPTLSGEEAVRLAALQDELRGVEVALGGVERQSGQTALAVGDVRSAIEKFVQAAGPALGQLSQAQYEAVRTTLQNLEALASSGGATAEGVTSSFKGLADFLEGVGVEVGGLRDAIGEVAGPTRTVGDLLDRQRQLAEEAAKAGVEGYEKLNEAGRKEIDQLQVLERERKKLHEEQVKRMEELTEKTEAGTERIAAAWDVAIAKCEEYRACVEATADAH